MGETTADTRATEHPRPLLDPENKEDALLLNKAAAHERSPDHVYHPEEGLLHKASTAKLGECYRWEAHELPRVEAARAQALRVFCGTWNVHGKTALVENLDEWLIKDPQHHIYVIGTCECEQSCIMASASTLKWEQQVKDHFGEEYFLVGAHALGAIHIMVFIHRYLWSYCWDVKTGQVATGIANIIGNKGGVQVGFNLGRTSFLFTNAHLAAHVNKMKERTASFSRIMRDSPLKRDKCSSGVHEEYDHVFFFGDLNARLDASRTEVDAWLSTKPPQLDKCLDSDQLGRLLHARIDEPNSGLWPLFSEASISFPPTYKFMPNTDTYDTSKQRRVPSWTDRILFKTDDNIHCLRYTSVPSLKLSDHKPIFGQYEISSDLDLEHREEHQFMPRDRPALIFQQREDHERPAARFQEKCPLYGTECPHSPRSDVGRTDDVASHRHSVLKPFISLIEKGVWSIEVAAKILEKADAEGHVIDLLKEMQLPLEHFPQIAQSCCLDVLEEFNMVTKRKFGTVALEDPETICKVHKLLSRFRRIEPHPLANLLANLIRVPHPLADTILVKLTEGILVYQIRTEEGQTLVAAPTESNFPKVMGAWYVQRFVTVRPGTKQAKHIRYNTSSRTLTLDKEGLRSYITSPLFPVTIPDDQKRGALIPLKANLFAYVMYGQQFEIGGFVYMYQAGKSDLDLNVLAINKLYFNIPQRYSLRFTKPRELPMEVADALRSAGRTQEVSVTELVTGGAKEYAFFGPHEPGFGTENVAGGFAYIFDDAAHVKNRYFLIEATAEVCNRCHIIGDMNSAVVSRVVTDNDTRILANRLNLVDMALDGTGFIGAGQYSCRTKNSSPIGVRVKIARLKCPDILHPVVLHALAIAPRQEVIATDAAKAIARTIFRKVRRWIVFDICFEFASFASLIRIAGVVRMRESSACPKWQDYPVLYVVFSYLCIAWLKKTSHETFVLLGHFRWHWEHEYLSYSKLLILFSLVVTIVLLCWIWTGDGFDHCDKLRPLIALLAVTVWFNICYQLRGFEFGRLGLRILPILEALKEVVDFILVLLLFYVAMCVVAYILSDKPIFEVLWSEYFIAILGEADRSLDVLLLNNEDDDPNSWQVFQYGSFVVFSFLVTVALMNIFIGVVSNAFECHQGRAQQLFARTQIHLGLEYTLVHESLRHLCLHRCRSPKVASRLGGPDEKYLWFCEEELDDVPASNAMQEIVRETVNGVSENLNSKMHSLEHAVKSVRHAVKAASAFSDSLELSRRFSHSTPTSPPAPELS